MTSSTPIGELLTVTLVQFLGAPGETFSVLLPPEDWSAHETHFKSFGVHTKLRGPAIVKDFVPTYDVHHLKGIAENAIIPLAQS